MSPTRAWHREFLWSAPSYFLSAVVAAVIAIIMRHDAYLLLPLAASPLYISYRAYQISVRRIDEERRHAQELAAMVATTQEALARAIQSESALEAEKERLVLAKARLAVTVETISDGVVTVDMSGSVLLMNDAAQGLTAMQESDLAGLPVGAVFDALGLPPATYQAALRRVLGDGQAVQLRNDAPGCGPAPRLVEITGTPTRDGEGDVAGAVWVLRDVSDAARLEHERSKAARLESLGVLAGGLAHDFNNILIGVVGNLSLAQTMVRPGDEALRARLTHAEAACVRARGVTNQLLTFAKGGAPVKTTASVRDLAVECTRFALSGSSVAPRFAVDPELWAADVDTVQIGQVVHNLVLNAMQAMPRGGVVDVHAPERRGHAAGSATGRRAAAGQVRLPRRRGQGTRHRRRAHEPHLRSRTSRPRRRARGSGWRFHTPSCARTAARSASSPKRAADRGSWCTCRRRPTSCPPRSAAAWRRRTCGPAAFCSWTTTPRSPKWRRTCSRAWATSTQVAPSGRHAIDQFREAELRGEPFDAVILDLTVPGGMGGSEAVPHIKDIRPDVPVVVTSGYADDSVLARFRDYGFDGVLPKPFAIPDLRRALEEADATARESQGRSGRAGNVSEQSTVRVTYP